MRPGREVSVNEGKQRHHQAAGVTYKQTEQAGAPLKMTPGRPQADVQGRHA
jgi:hypothetical protein